MSPLLWEHCLATRVVVLTGVRQEQREAISHMSGAVSTCYLQYTKEVITAIIIKVLMVQIRRFYDFLKA